MPGYSPSFGAEALGISYGSFKLFRPEYDSQIELIRPSYDSDKPEATVVRPKPCMAYAGCEGDFMPYRLDPGGHNYMGFWFTQVAVADRIGTPATTFIVHRPKWAGGERADFDASTNPLSVLVRAVVSAIRKGQNRHESWRAAAVKKAFEPNAELLFSWTGTRGGDSGEMKSLKAPTYMGLMQALVPQHGGKVKWGRDNQTGEALVPPGWGEKTCVVGLTAAASMKLIAMCKEEKPNFRGDPADFENRYVHGDPVSITSGRFLYIYPKGGDPRQSRGVDPNYDPLLTPHGAGGSGGARGKDSREFAGYDMHFDTQFQGVPAAFVKPDMSPAQRQAVIDYLRSKWLYWEDILDFPNDQEQVSRLAAVLPLSMIDYAFTGEHDSWISPELKKRIDESRHTWMSVAPPPPSAPHLPPSAPGAGGPPSSPSGSGPNSGGPLGSVPGWNGSSAQLPPAGGGGPPQAFPAGSLPWDAGSPDQALPKPSAPISGGGSIDDALAAAAKEANDIFSAPPLPVTPPATNTAAPTGAAAIAAARKKAGQPA
jgi:hypothetical protein